MRTLSAVTSITFTNSLAMIKRTFDITLSLIGFIIISPVFLILMFLVRWKMGSPVFFSQIRPGLHGKSFTIYKFRTMTNETDAEGSLLSNKHRLTRFGQFLRSTSLDELPELINVIKGEMSLVGPRPLMMDYLPWYSQEQKRRHNLKPGITGWAQVNGRNAINWDKKLALDVWYVNNRSLWLDIKILLKTVIKVFKREGISHKDDVAMPRFDDYVKEMQRQV